MEERMLSTLVTSCAMKRTVLAKVCVLSVVGAGLIAPCAGAPASQSALTSLRPGQVQETIGSAATVTSTVHYQVSLVLTCQGAACRGDLPTPGRHRLINVTRVSCAFLATGGAIVGPDHADVVDSNGTIKVGEYLPVNYTNAQGWNIINQAIDLQVVGSQHLELTMFFPTGEGSEGACTATGTLSTLG
jgi:hypothetical protein